MASAQVMALLNLDGVYPACGFGAKLSIKQSFTLRNCCYVPWYTHCLSFVALASLEEQCVLPCVCSITCFLMYPGVCSEYLMYQVYVMNTCVCRYKGSLSCIQGLDVPNFTSTGFGGFGKLHCCWCECGWLRLLLC